MNAYYPGVWITFVHTDGRDIVACVEQVTRSAVVARSVEGETFNVPRNTPTVRLRRG